MSTTPSVALSAAIAARDELNAFIESFGTGVDGITSNRDAVIERCYSFIRKLHPPPQYAMQLIPMTWFYAALCAVLQLGILKNLPGDGSVIGVKELAAKVDVKEELVSRLLKTVATEEIVEEVEDEQWRIMELGKAFLIPPIQSATMIFLEWMETPKYLASSLKGSKEPSEENCAFTLAKGTKCYQYLLQNEEFAKNFGLAMEGSAASENFIPVIKEWIVQSGYTQGKFIDVGGGKGHVIDQLSKELPNLNFELQDVDASQFHALKSSLTVQQKSQISFVQQDFFLPQAEPTTKIIAFYFRRVFHNWEDEDAVKILCNFIPLMEKDRDTALLINEFILPARGTVEKHVEKKARTFDIGMLLNHGSKERSAAMWDRLLKQVDQRLEIKRIMQNKHTPMLGLIEVRLN